MFLVFRPGRGPDGPQRAARQSRFEKVGRIAGSGSAPCPDKRMGFIDEHDDRHGRGLNLVDHLPQAVFELPLHRRTRLQQPHVERQQPRFAKRGRNVAPCDPQSKAFDHSGLADACFPGQDRVVLTPPHQHIDNLADFLVTPDNRIDLSVAGLFGQVGAELGQRFLLAHRARRHRARRFARHGTAAGLRSVLRAQAVFDRAIDNLAEIVRQVICTDLGKLLGNVHQDRPQFRRLEHPEDQVTRPHLIGIVE